MAAPLPVDKGRLLSPYGMRRGRTSGEPTYHAGLDLGHPRGRGTPVFAIQGGRVERVSSDDNPPWGFNGYGNAVIIDHGDGTWAMYAHLDRALVSKGDKISPGELIGRMGNTSNRKFPGMGVHLHVELREPKPDGSSPFPGPYKRFNLDPQPWIERTGVYFGDRGEMSLKPGSESWYADAYNRIRDWWFGDEESEKEGKPVSGVDPYPTHKVRGFKVPETAMAGLGAEEGGENTYEPVYFDRDPRFGLTPIEWASAGAGAIILTSVGAAFVIRRTPGDVEPNRRRKRRRRGRKRRTSRRTSRRR